MTHPVLGDDASPKRASAGPFDAERESIRAEQDRPRTVSDRGRCLLRDSVVIDMIQPMENGNLTKYHLLEQARAVGFTFVSVTIYPDSDARASLDGIGAVRRYVAEHSDNFIFAHNSLDIARAQNAGRTAIGVNFQETLPLGGNLDLLPVYKSLGISHMLLAYNRRNMVADGCTEVVDNGLSRFGRDVVKEMSKIGILCDGSHTGYRSSMEAMELYDGPFIFSHSNCKAVFNHYRNIADDQIQACAATGGVIGINGVGMFLDDPYARAESMFRHIDHVVSLVGETHVGIGLDRMADLDLIYQYLHDNAAMWPDNDGRPMRFSTFSSHAVIGEVVDLMLAHGYSEAAITGYLGQNFLRVLERVWT